MFYTAISGLNAFRQQLALISDNIANSQTRAFKSGDVSFAEVINASATTNSVGSVGNGVSLQNIAVGWTQGAISNTGNANDYAITGSGFFIVKDPAGMIGYTRDGQFLYSAEGKLINADNSAVQGYAINQTTGVVDTSKMDDITITSALVPGKATTLVNMTVNLDADTATEGTFSTTTNIYDSQGKPIALTTTFTKVEPTFTLNLSANTMAGGEKISIGGITYTATSGTAGVGEFSILGDATADAGSLRLAIPSGALTVGGTGSTITITAGTAALTAGTVALGTPAASIAISNNTLSPSAWSWAAAIPSDKGTATGSGILEFDSSGGLVTGTGTDPTISLALTGGLTTAGPVTWDLYNAAGTATNGSLTQYAAPSTLYSMIQNGTEPGEIKSMSTDSNGIITAAYSNGVTKSLFQIALADFKNYDGLNKTGNNIYRETPSISGEATEGVAGSSTFGTLVSGSLEASNVDMAKEMASMILAQRAYESCARVFTTESEMLKTIVNMS
jgi:flagellar hook protein FlgE